MRTPKGFKELTKEEVSDFFLAGIPLIIVNSLFPQAWIVRWREDDKDMRYYSFIPHLTEGEFSEWNLYAMGETFVEEEAILDE